MPDQEKITGVAVIVGSLMFSLPRPYRHHNVLRAVYDQLTEVGENKQGFVTDSGKYLDRKEALELAIKNGQLLPEEPVHANRLFSENLWRDKDPDTPIHELRKLTTITKLEPGDYAKPTQDNFV